MQTLAKPTDSVNPQAKTDFLGIYTKSLDPPPSDLPSRRIERWSLQSASRHLLQGFKRVDKKENLQAKFRVSQCLRLPVGSDIKIKSKNKTAHYQGLNACGSIWTCPICAAKISERRRKELSHAVETWQESGGSVLLVTTTVPHNKSMRFKHIQQDFQLARNKWRDRKPWKRTLEKRDIWGTVRALEATVGANGWHLHVHELFFLGLGFKDTPEERENLKHELYQQWASAAESAGFERPSYEHGLDVSGGDYAAQYVAKWGLEHELTKGHIKKSNKGYSPWDLLRSFLQTGDITNEIGDRSPDPLFSPGAYFQEFAWVMLGKSQLHWSQGLKRLLQIEVKSDEELANEEVEDDLHIGNLTLSQWRLILKHDKRGTILEYANMGGMPAVLDYITSLLTKAEYRKDKSIPF